jgi:hypothetical protein
LESYGSHPCEAGAFHRELEPRQVFTKESVVRDVSLAGCDVEFDFARMSVMLQPKWDKPRARTQYYFEQRFAHVQENPEAFHVTA